MVSRMSRRRNDEEAEAARKTPFSIGEYRAGPLRPSLRSLLLRFGHTCNLYRDPHELVVVAIRAVKGLFFTWRRTVAIPRQQYRGAATARLMGCQCLLYHSLLATIES